MTQFVTVIAIDIKYLFIIIKIERFLKSQSEHELLGVAGHEGRTAGQEDVQHDSRREHVRRLAALARQDHFRRHVALQSARNRN